MASRIHEIRDAIATFLGAQPFAVPVAIKSGSLQFSEVDVQQFPTLFVSDLQETINTAESTRGLTAVDYKIGLTVTSYLNRYSQDELAEVVDQVKEYLYDEYQSGARQTTMNDGAPVNTFESGPNEQRNYFESLVEIEYSEFREV